jgi:hypothetical protein
MAWLWCRWSAAAAVAASTAIPPQRQLDISSHKKIIVCEHCGRILVDDTIVESVAQEK